MVVNLMLVRWMEPSPTSLPHLMVCKPGLTCGGTHSWLLPARTSWQQSMPGEKCPPAGA
jgi:hypothetical protein